MKTYSLILAVGPHMAFAFLPPLKLQCIISSKAIIQTIFQDIRVELTNRENIFINILDFRPTSAEYFIISVFILFLYGQYKYIEGVNHGPYNFTPAKQEKLENLEQYKFAKTLAKELFFICMIVFYKNVESAF